jgi:hypothetical protein
MVRIAVDLSEERRGSGNVVFAVGVGRFKEEQHPSRSRFFRLR